MSTTLPVDYENSPMQPRTTAARAITMEKTIVNGAVGSGFVAYGEQRRRREVSIQFKI